ncbi:MAG: hypothetical protein Q4C25_03435 [Bacillota bacterium]|nr:hypothetical protein [Bacillota bacterium]
MILCSKSEDIMERSLRKIIIFVVVVAFMIPLLTPQVFAASSVSISGGDSVKGGDTFTVVVTYNGDNIGRVNGGLTYDTGKLSYISGGSSTGNTGYVQLSKAGTGEPLSFSIKFQAVSEGSTQLTVSTIDLYNLDEESMDNPSGSKTVNISGNAATNELITETTSEGSTVETTEGLDEKPEEGISSTVVLIIAIAVVLVLIAIIAAVLISKRKKPKGPGGNSGGSPDTKGSGAKKTLAEENPFERQDAREEHIEPEPDELFHGGYEPQDKGETVAGRSAKYRNAKADTQTIKTDSWDEWEGYDDGDR